MLSYRMTVKEERTAGVESERTMAAKAFGLLLAAAVAFIAVACIPSAEAGGGCGAGVAAHAPGFMPNCDPRDPPGIHRAGERYCAMKTETSAYGDLFCPPDNHWISKAEAYRRIGQSPR